MIIMMGNLAYLCRLASKEIHIGGYRPKRLVINFVSSTELDM
jgi:hypothetical protein